MKNKLGTIACLLAVVQVMLILVSWVIAAAFPELNTHSLLSSEGIRWFFGRFVDNMQTRFLVWIILVTIALGAFNTSGLTSAISPRISAPLHYRQRMALRVVGIELIVLLVAIVLLTAIPHAVLLSVTGSLWPSSFSASIIPIVTFIVSICSITYGLISGKLKTNADVYHALTIGPAQCAFILPLYILIVQLVQSALFVFNQI